MGWFNKKKKSSGSSFMKNGEFDIDAFMESVKKSDDPFGLNKAKGVAENTVINLKIGDELSESKRWNSGGIEFFGTERYTVCGIEGNIVLLKTHKGDIIKMSKEDIQGKLSCFLMHKD